MGARRVIEVVMTLAVVAQWSTHRVKRRLVRRMVCEGQGVYVSECMHQLPGWLMVARHRGLRTNPKQVAVNVKAAMGMQYPQPESVSSE
jgi:hypothetical protein